MDILIEFLCSTRMTVVSGIFLAGSLLLSSMDINIGFDPALITVVISGLPIVYSAVKKLVKNKGMSRISSALLITVAMVGAILIGDLFASGEVAFIMALGEILEEKTTKKAKRGLHKLISLAPNHGRVVENGTEKIVSCEKIKVGDILRILPGERIAVDGEIICGETSVDQSVITGESLPVDKQAGDSVFCGTLNRFGTVDIRATKVGSDSSLSNLIRLVKEAEKRKAPMERTADKWASYLVPLALIIAVVSFIFTKDAVRAVTVLVVFCPCALVLATPTAIMAAIGQASKNGVIIKSGEALEKMGRANIIAFDKTGTLTCGKPVVCDVVSCDENFGSDAVLSAVATAEVRSEHPLAKAIVSYAQEKDIGFVQPHTFTMEAGKGVRITWEKGETLCGNRRYIEENGIEIPEKIHNALEQFHCEGKGSVVVSLEGKCIGVISLADKIKTETKSVVQRLTRMGIRIAVLTGDNRRTADFIAKTAGIDEIYAELLPHGKVSALEKLKEKDNTVCMIGDGVNDAPALKIADVGVAMGVMGSDIAVEASDIAIMSDDLSKIPYLKRLSVCALKTIRLSIFLSLFINFVAIILSLMGFLGPTTGALVHNAGSLFVVLISAMLYDKKIK